MSGVVRGPAGNNDCRIYVGNLPPDIRTKDVEDVFYKYGTIRDIDLKNRRGGPPFAFIEFEDPRYGADLGQNQPLCVANALLRDQTITWICIVLVTERGVSLLAFLSIFMLNSIHVNLSRLLFHEAGFLCLCLLHVVKGYHIYYSLGVVAALKMN